MAAPADSLAAMDDVLAKGRDTLQQAVTQGAETTRVVLDKATALMRDTADQAQGHLTGSVADMAALSRDSFDTAVETGAELVKTVETLHKAQFDLLARAMDSAVATAKALSEAKSANELIAVQTDYVRGAADSLMVETTRMVELTGKMMQDVAQPCQARFTAAWDRIGKSVAA